MNRYTLIFFFKSALLDVASKTCMEIECKTAKEVIKNYQDFFDSTVMETFVIDKSSKNIHYYDAFQDKMSNTEYTALLWWDSLDRDFQGLFFKSYSIKRSIVNTSLISNEDKVNIFIQRKGFEKYLK